VHRRRNFPLIDSVRAIAALSVLVFHVAQVTGTGESRSWGGYLMRLNVGVTLFFIISAFLLYRPFVAARLGVGPPVSVRRYLRSRALRILPAYWFALAVLMLVPGALVGVDARHWWIYFGFLQVYDVHRIVLGISPAWSLSTEVAFYLFLPRGWSRVLSIAATGRRSRASSVSSPALRPPRSSCARPSSTSGSCAFFPTPFPGRSPGSRLGSPSPS